MDAAPESSRATGIGQPAGNERPGNHIEREVLFPTLPTLLRVALVFGVGLEHFFLEARERPVVAVVRKADRRRFPERPGAKHAAYHFECLDFPATERPMSGYYVEFQSVPDTAVRPHDHRGFELIFVVEGRLGVTIGGSETVLYRGDAMYFDASQPHSYRKAGGRTCAAVVVTA